MTDAAAEETERAREAALRKLTARACSRQRLAEHLRRGGFGEQAVEEALLRLSRVGLVDDAAFARQWVSQRRGAKGLGLARLREELRKQGVAEELVEAALAEAADTGEDEDAVARDFARRRLRSLAGLDRTAFERRLAGQLGRRGFPSAVVRRVVLEFAAEREAGLEAETVDWEDVTCQSRLEKRHLAKPIGKASLAKPTGAAAGSSGRRMIAVSIGGGVGGGSGRLVWAAGPVSCRASRDSKTGAVDEGSGRLVWAIGRVGDPGRPSWLAVEAAASSGGGDLGPPPRAGPAVGDAPVGV
ncbi:MAG: recombination regulator RecX [Propionibacteriaceae bacterium]|nr:recombination regulator RecX [Propionibacteriaceae bacterium]